MKYKVSSLNCLKMLASESPLHLPYPAHLGNKRRDGVIDPMWPIADPCMEKGGKSLCLRQFILSEGFFLTLKSSSLSLTPLPQNGIIPASFRHHSGNDS